MPVSFTRTSAMQATEAATMRSSRKSSSEIQKKTMAGMSSAAIIDCAKNSGEIESSPAAKSPAPNVRPRRSASFRVAMAPAAASASIAKRVAAIE